MCGHILFGEFKPWVAPLGTYLKALGTQEKGGQWADRSVVLSAVLTCCPNSTFSLPGMK